MVDLWIPPIRSALLGRHWVWAGQVVGQGDFHPDRPARGNQRGDLPRLAALWARITLAAGSISHLYARFRFLINNPSRIGLPRLPVVSTRCIDL